MSSWTDQVKGYCMSILRSISPANNKQKKIIFFREINFTKNNKNKNYGGNYLEVII